MWWCAAVHAVVLPLRLSLLAERAGESAPAVRARYRERHNNTHATEYVGRIVVGGQPFDVLFDTGSDQLLLPSVDCPSPACQQHRRYDPSGSPSASAPREARVLTFGEGRAAGLERSDVVCLASACANVTFVDALEESERPFLSAGFDGVVGLSLPLRKNATSKTSVLEALVTAGALPREQFAVGLGGEPWIDFEPSVPPETTWVNLSESGYWQFALQSIRIGSTELTCGTMQPGANVSTFFGRMCCRTLDEFEHEQRCQLEASAKRSRYSTPAVLLARYADGRLAVRMEDGCVQKVPISWVSDLRGCRDGAFQAVVDTGMSLMTAPPALAAEMLAHLDVPENCTDRANFSALAFDAGGVALELAPEQYMDQVVLSDGVFCWPHLVPMPPTAKGPVLVLGLPFLRAFTTVFDVADRRLGFARKPGPRHRAVRLRGRRGGG